MVPITVERRWNGKPGSLSWWVAVQMDEAERIKRKLEAPDQNSWARQYYKILVLNQLVYDDDFNRTNLLIGPDWKLWRIDFSRGFRLFKNLQKPEDLQRCDRQLLEKMRALNAKEFEQRTKNLLDKWERDGVMGRRDKMVKHFEKLIAEKGEDKILY